MNQTTQLLRTFEAADAPRVDQLVPSIYSELRGMAHRQLSREARNPTLETVELVHEAYVRMVGDERVTKRGRAYFFAAAARAMRQVLIDAARRRGAAKRGGGEAHLTFDEKHFAVDQYASELMGLDAALADLESRSPRQVRVVECRFFAGMSVEETAAALDVSARTVKSDWALARAWLFAELRGTND